MALCGGSAASAVDIEKVNALVASYICYRAQRRNKERALELAKEAQSKINASLKLRLVANSFAIAAMMATDATVHRERWAFERNERWFEETLPHLGENHFRQAFRVSQTTFRYLVESCRIALERQTTNMRKPLSVEKRVAVGMYRLCSSAEDRTIAHLFGIGRSTVNVVFREFCKAVTEQLEAEWLRMVRRHELEKHVREFFFFTGFPQAIGALDGCHFPISPPKDNAIDYHNYKGWYSVILLALVDHQYRFRYINVGAPGRCHDANVYGRSKLHTPIESGHLDSPVIMIEGAAITPLILCDQAFPLTATLLKPFPSASPGTPEAAYNYNLSKTRRIVENAFGRLKARFRFVMKRQECKLPNAKQAIRAACVLHNICETFRDPVDPQWEQDVPAFDELFPQPSRSTTQSSGTGHSVRAALAQYFWRRAQQAT
ncbi:uncharacterized protein [Dermacentor albipictus]|uniref:uncharacterized protein n=1 Tax=Dermacentor albipictus TaxID=60249 RepID=UPI0038FBE991